MTPTMGLGCCRLALTSFLLPPPSSSLLLFFGQLLAYPLPVVQTPQWAIPSVPIRQSQRQFAATAHEKKLRLAWTVRGEGGGVGVCEGVATEVDATPKFPVPDSALSVSLPAKFSAFVLGQKNVYVFCIWVSFGLCFFLLLLLFFVALKSS